MHWKLRALAFKALHHLPAADALHYWVQRNVTRTLPRPEYTHAAIRAHANRFAELMAAHLDKPIADCEVLEFGVGRDLALAVALRACGVGRIIAADLTPLARVELVQTALSRLFPQPFKLHSLSELKEFGIDYRAPFDMRDTKMPEGSLDCVLSSEVLEHVSVQDARALSIETYRILRHGGAAIMKIDYSDHYARTDNDLLRFNFLKYSDRRWKKYNNRLQYLNRLRHVDFLRLFENCGFVIAHTETQQGTVRDDVVRSLDERFKSYTLDELFARSGLIVAQKR